MPYAFHDSPPDAIRQLRDLTTALHDLLGADLISMVLHGSLAMGCFNPTASDLDVLVITRRRLAADESMHLAAWLLAHSAQPHPFEISLVRLQDCIPWQYPTPYDFHYSEDWRERFTRLLAAGSAPFRDKPMPTDSDLAAHFTVARARGVALYGPPPAGLLPPVPPADYAYSIMADLDWGRERAGQLPVYFILNAYRILAFLESGHIFSKQEGGLWGMARLPDGFQALIARALSAYAGNAVAAFDHEIVEQFATMIEHLIRAAYLGLGASGRERA